MLEHKAGLPYGWLDQEVVPEPPAASSTSDIVAQLAAQELDWLVDQFKVQADADTVLHDGPKRLAAFDYFKRGYMLKCSGNVAGIFQSGAAAPAPSTIGKDNGNAN